jgi:hypothetical protein
MSHSTAFSRSFGELLWSWRFTTKENLSVQTGEALQARDKLNR